MPLLLYYLFIKSLYQICFVALSIKYKQNSGPPEDIWPYQNGVHTNFSIKDRGITGLNDIHLFQLTLTTQYWKWESIWPSCILGTPYSLKKRTTMRPCRILPKWFSCISQVISINFKYFQHFQKEISPKTWVSCKVLYQAFNILHFPLVKANWNRCITWLWIIAMQSRNAIVTVHTCYFCKMLEMWDKIWSSQFSTMTF